MPNHTDRTALAKEWFAKAEADFDIAELSLEETEHYGTVCFLCQQGAEKYLKGFLVSKGISPRKIHSLATLLKQCSLVHPDFKDHLEAGKRLDSYYIPTRYPVPQTSPYSKREAKKALEEARAIASQALELL